MRRGIDVKSECDLSFERDQLTANGIWPVFPLLDGVDTGLRQILGARDPGSFPHISRFTDENAQDYGSLNATCACFFGIADWDLLLNKFRGRSCRQPDGSRDFGSRLHCGLRLGDSPRRAKE